MDLHGNRQLAARSRQYTRCKANIVYHYLLRRRWCCVRGCGHCYSMYVVPELLEAQNPKCRRSFRCHLGPFELTKLSAQLSVLMANNKGSMGEPTERPRPSHLPQQGTVKTAMNLVKQKGIMGLYSGFNVHLCKSETPRVLYNRFWAKNTF